MSALVVVVVVVGARKKMLRIHGNKSQETSKESRISSFTSSGDASDRLVYPDDADDDVHVRRRFVVILSRINNIL